MVRSLAWDWVFGSSIIVEQKEFAGVGRGWFVAPLALTAFEVNQVPIALLHFQGATSDSKETVPGVQG